MNIQRTCYIKGEVWLMQNTQNKKKQSIKGESQINGIVQEILFYLNYNLDLKITKAKFLV
jgi:hypothetical protein